jgi:protein arginine N-methyltransferase 1
MPPAIRKYLLLFFRDLVKLLKSSKACRTLLLTIKNDEEFSDLYEHEKMLADSVRVASYHNAIKRHIKPGEVVLDLGTGTGILSFFAAQQKPRKIYAIDHSDFIEVARKIAAHNNIGNIQFVRTNSRNFTPEEKVDVILHEQIGDDLFNENMIENILDLKHRVLKETGRILPGRFELFLEPVSIRKDHKVPFLWENNVDGVDFGFLKQVSEIDRFKRVGYDMKWLEPGTLNYFLCQPKAVFAFDLNELKAQSDIPKSIRASKKVVHSGEMDGLCFYFRVIFDADINFDTSPLNTKTHWGNHLFRIESRYFEIGSQISYKLTMEDILDLRTWSVSINQDESPRSISLPHAMIRSHSRLAER